MAKIIDELKQSCSNFLYIFIPDNAVDYFLKNGGSVIIKKRQNQIGYITKAAQLSKYSYAELKKAIGDEIVAVYGKTPEEVILDVANGKNVYSKTNVKQNAVSGIGSIGAIDKFGYIQGKNVLTKYSTVYDAETGNAVARYLVDSGKQVSYFDTKTNTWKAGVTPTTDPNSRLMWGNNIDWTSIIMYIIQLIGNWFGVKLAKNLSAYQSDGWYGITQNTTQNSTNNALPLLLLSGSVYVAAMAENKKKRKKRRKKTNKE